ncbi:serine hydrolase domain-containing protein [Flavobacterium selenitireducens]|uniref:serine hydrolase domain-containing protein n=1 Tax=Flavobacterium selenitireducens TaxID=2722704 RepID=UPI00168A5DDC|nr:serine hydrolase domain-containing protein [Flavobacterium selenitireducens]MBD3581963.1 beta-lactamase family protein [Flavobacterium selenitireducens]
MMRYARLFVFLVCATCFAQQPDRDAGKALDAELSALQEKGFFNGFSVAIANADGTLYTKGFGSSDVASGKPYTSKTIQNIASVSKTVVGIAIMKAQEMGKLKLDDDINLYLPFKVSNPSFPNVPITLRQLATHTSSIVDTDAYLNHNYFLKPDQNLDGLPLSHEDQKFIPRSQAMTLENYLKAVLTPDGKYYADDVYVGKPGETYDYSNTGTALAAYVVAQAVGVPFGTFTEKHIMKPLRMNASGWGFSMVDSKSYSRLYANPATPLPFYELTTYPDGNFVTSADDMSKFISELINGYQGKGKLLSKASYAEYFRPQLDDAKFKNRNQKNPYSESYNVGIFIGFGPTGLIGHTGGDPGVSSLMFIDPKTKIGRYVIVNTNFTNKEGQKAFYEIIDILAKYQDRL